MPSRWASSAEISAEVSSSRAAVPPPARNAKQRRDDAGDHAAARFGEAELGCGSRDDDVAGEHEPSAARDGRAVHRGDDRLGQLDHLRHELAVGLGRVAPVLGLFCVGQRGGGVHFVDVHAGAEGLAGAGEHDRPHALFEVQVAERFAELSD